MAKVLYVFVLVAFVHGEKFEWKGRLPGYPYPDVVGNGSSLKVQVYNEDVPANYVHYQFPSAGVSNDIVTKHVWSVIPSTQAIFSSTQIAFENGDTGYLGTQIIDGRGKAIFSAWNEDGQHKPSWSGSACGHFGGEGEGAHCLIDYDIRADVTYTMEMKNSGNDGGNDLWVGTIKDEESGAITNLGTLKLPNDGGRQGFGQLQIDASAFMEWFEATGCQNQCEGAVTQVGPYFKGGSLMPSSASASYKTNNCFLSDVSGCLPGATGDMCGSPNGYMRGGGNTHRVTVEGQQLWDGSKQDVSCGGSREPTCDDCPQGHGEAWCNGDCSWQGGTCVPATEGTRLTPLNTTSATAAPPVSDVIV